MQPKFGFEESVLVHHGFYRGRTILILGYEMTSAISHPLGFMGGEILYRGLITTIRGSLLEITVPERDLIQ